MTTNQTDEHVRRTIRDAMDRLIDGKALHSDGKLTVKSLAEEARVKRWLLTHRHTDLQDEFRARLDKLDSEPTVTNLLMAQAREAEGKIKALTAEISGLKATVHQLERIISVLALENHDAHADRLRSDSATSIRRKRR